jgi:hypothetical protein
LFLATITEGVQGFADGIVEADQEGGIAAAGFVVDVLDAGEKLVGGLEWRMRGVEG